MPPARIDDVTGARDPIEHRQLKTPLCQRLQLHQLVLWSHPAEWPV